VPYASKTQARIPERELLDIATPIVTVAVRAGLESSFGGFDA